MNDSNSPHGFDPTAILESLPDAVFVLDRDHYIRFWNRIAEQITGYSRASVVDHLCPDGVLHTVQAHASGACQHECPAQLCLEDNQPREMVTYIRHRDGRAIPVRVKLAPIVADGSITGVVHQFSDMTPRVASARSRTPEPHEWVDEHTLLPSVMASAAQIRENFERWSMHADYFSIILLEPDGLETAAERCGEAARHRLFLAISKSLLACVRDSDFLGRWMDDQFLVLLPHCNLPQARTACQRILKLCGRVSIQHDGMELSATLRAAASMVLPEDDPATLLGRAVRELSRQIGLYNLSAAGSGDNVPSR